MLTSSLASSTHCTDKNIVAERKLCHFLEKNKVQALIDYSIQGKFLDTPFQTYIHVIDLAHLSKDKQSHLTLHKFLSETLPYIITPSSQQHTQPSQPTQAINQNSTNKPKAKLQLSKNITYPQFLSFRKDKVVSQPHLEYALANYLALSDIYDLTLSQHHQFLLEEYCNKFPTMLSAMGKLSAVKHKIIKSLL